jgi:hypothetical protein
LAFGVNGGAGETFALLSRWRSNAPGPKLSSTGDAVGLSEQAEQEVLRPDEVVTEVAGLLLGPHQCVPGLLREPLEHRR